MTHRVLPIENVSTTSPIHPVDPIDTIVAISTPPGRGGIGIVRLSGSRALSIALSLVPIDPLPTHAKARFAHVLDPETAAPLDEAIVTFFASPHSYTAEDVVEIATHGSPVILAHIVRSAVSLGARLAEPGEFTQRAFLNGRLDLVEAEAVHDLIQASTLRQARVAASQLEGVLSRSIRPVKQKLIELIATMEAGIDFAEDDIDLLSAHQISRSLADICHPLAALEQTYSFSQILRDGFSLAIVGRPNAGKSSLFNALLQRQRAIVTAAPGTTRDLITDELALDGIPVRLIDTAGLRTATDEAEVIGIAKTREVLADADVVLLVIDATEAVPAEITDLISNLRDRPLLIACNKMDLVQEPNRSPALDRPSLTHTPVIKVSALSGRGLGDLRAAIVAVLTDQEIPAESGLITNLRQHDTITSALKILQQVKAEIPAGLPHEVILLDLRQALNHLDTLTGQTTTEEILQRIFSTFCIGK